MTEKQAKEFIEEIIKSAEQTPEEDNQIKERVLPLIALRGKVFCPSTLLNFDVGRPMSIAAVERAVTLPLNTELLTFISAPKDVLRTLSLTDPLRNVVASVAHLVSIRRRAAKITLQYTNVWEDYYADIDLPDGVQALYFRYVGQGNVSFKEFELICE